MPDANLVVPQAAKPTVVAIDMGYGHLRPARAIATMIVPEGAPLTTLDPE